MHINRDEDENIMHLFRLQIYRPETTFIAIGAVAVAKNKKRE